MFSDDAFSAAAASLKARLNQIEVRIEHQDGDVPMTLLPGFTIRRPGEALPDNGQVIHAFKARLAAAIPSRHPDGPIAELAERVKRLGGNALLNIRPELGHIVGVPALVGRVYPSDATREELRQPFTKNEHLVFDELQPLIDHVNQTSAVTNNKMLDAWWDGFWTAAGK